MTFIWSLIFVLWENYYTMYNWNMMQKCTWVWKISISRDYSFYVMVKICFCWCIYCSYLLPDHCRNICHKFIENCCICALIWVQQNWELRNYAVVFCQSVWEGFPCCITARGVEGSKSCHRCCKLLFSFFYMNDLMFMSQLIRSCSAAEWCCSTSSSSQRSQRSSSVALPTDTSGDRAGK